jgi:acetyl esterase/lipase
MKRISLAILMTVFMQTTDAQMKIPLYPGQTGLTIGGREKISEAPHLLYHSAGSGTSKPCVLICPGGAYTALAMGHEGRDVAAFFNSRGYDAFILLYRLNVANQSGSRFPAQYDDVTTAMRIIKSRQTEFGIDPSKTGILGFSAGGHLASMAATMHRSAVQGSDLPLERQDSRPAFAILIYPVISMTDSFRHAYSGEMLLGKNADKTMRDSLSTYNRVNGNTPPTFIVFASDDKSVPPQNGLVFYEALLRNKVNASLHIFDHGGHGFGMAPKDPILSQWPDMAVKWLTQVGMK